MRTTKLLWHYSLFSNIKSLSIFASIRSNLSVNADCRGFRPLHSAYRQAELQNRCQRRFA
jgi:hypothetical protein